MTTVREDVLAFYTLRTFSLEVVSSPPVKKKKGGVDVGVVSRTVYQYHYTAWPDHGVPLTDCSEECQKDSSCNSFSFR